MSSGRPFSENTTRKGHTGLCRPVKLDQKLKWGKKQFDPIPHYKILTWLKFIWNDFYYSIYILIFLALFHRYGSSAHNWKEIYLFTQRSVHISWFLMQPADGSHSFANNMWFSRSQMWLSLWNHVHRAWSSYITDVRLEFIPLCMTQSQRILSL